MRCMLLCVLLLFSLLSSPSVVQLVTSEIDGPPLRNRKRGVHLYVVVKLNASLGLLSVCECACEVEIPGSVEIPLFSSCF